MSREVTFTPEESDYIAAGRAWFLEALRRRRTFCVFAVAIVAGIGLAAFFAPTSPLSLDDFPALIAWALYPPMLMIVLYVITYALIPRRTRRLWKQQKTLQGPVTFRWSDQGLEMIAPKGQSKLDWTDIHKGFANGRMFIFYLHDRAYYYVPRAALSVSDEKDLGERVAAVNARSKEALVGAGASA